MWSVLSDVLNADPRYCAFSKRADVIVEEVYAHEFVRIGCEVIGCYVIPVAYCNLQLVVTSCQFIQVHHEYLAYGCNSVVHVHVAAQPVAAHSYRISLGQGEWVSNLYGRDGLIRVPDAKVVCCQRVGVGVRIRQCYCYLLARSPIVAGVYRDGGGGKADAGFYAVVVFEFE